MWLKSQMHARDTLESGLANARVDGHPDEIRAWKILQPIVTCLVRQATVIVACDPERSTYEPGLPAVIWGWAVVESGTVHGVGIKRSVVRAGLGEDLARDLLGARLETEQRTTFELVDLAKLKMIPKEWRRDRGWLSSLRSLSTRVLDGDSMFERVGDFVLSRREEWRPSSERAA